jgi:glutaredoxin 3
VAHPDHEYVDVKQSPQNMEAMLKCTGGKRNVPVIVEGEKVTVGYGGS